MHRLIVRHVKVREKFVGLRDQCQRSGGGIRGSHAYSLAAIVTIKKNKLIARVDGCFSAHAAWGATCRTRREGSRAASGENAASYIEKLVLRVCKHTAIDGSGKGRAAEFGQGSSASIDGIFVDSDSFLRCVKHPPEWIPHRA